VSLPSHSGDGVEMCGFAELLNELSLKVSGTKEQFDIFCDDSGFVTIVGEPLEFGSWLCCLNVDQNISDQIVVAFQRVDWTTIRSALVDDSQRGLKWGLNISDHIWTLGGIMPALIRYFHYVPQLRF
jgi:hypothetical protein